jgi:adenosine deaminase
MGSEPPEIRSAPVEHAGGETAGDLPGVHALAHPPVRQRTPNEAGRDTRISQVLAGKTPDLSRNLAAIPKVELHRHLEGSLRLTTIRDLVLSEGLDLPADLDRLRELVQIRPSDPRTPQTFLSKFEPLRRVFQSPDIIQRVVGEAVADAAAENIIYLEMHFTPMALAQERGFSLRDVFDWVTQAAVAAKSEESIQLGLIASVNRHEPVAVAKEVAGAAIEWMHKGVVGLSLAGDELRFASDPFHGLLGEARQAGLGLTVHAGEWAGADSVRRALEIAPDMRIGHGVRALEDPDVVRLAVERRTVFEVCPTSNIQSGVVPSASEHPLVRMIEAGLRVSIDSDDPRVSQITLADEYALAIEHLGVTLETVMATILGSAQAIFQPVAVRDALETRLKTAFFG